MKFKTRQRYQRYRQKRRSLRTIVAAEWLNQVQQELSALLNAAGAQSPDPGHDPHHGGR